VSQQILKAPWQPGAWYPSHPMLEPLQITLASAFPQEDIKWQ